ncbi:hypothetical protein [Thiomonas arsenitoxydans]|uniref:Uncharacterized protein n=1 Tax=Thiomonas arsenitoxydans (strain DSM 22701 / CIP 110005 / 3As) TaxID=426114 RepID=D6CTV3_THIA3|nr:hypothetical protein [Thiomonas arsenitoxydans]CAZ88722.1 hypothetical protein THI_2067 [Thiomonas arsenitoxydans]
MSQDKISDTIDHIRALAVERINPIAERFGVSPRLLYAGGAFILLLAVALISGLLAGHPTPAQIESAHRVITPPPQPAPAVLRTPAPAPVQPQSAVTSATTTAPTAPLQVELPALPAPASQMKSGAWQLTVQTVAAAQGQDPTTLAGQTVGTVINSSPTASFSGAVPTSMANFVTAGKPVRLAYSFDFNAPATGSYLITANLAGNASATARVMLDGRADPLFSLKRNFNALWSADAPAQVGSASVTLAAGLHSIESVLDTTAATQAAHAPTLDFYIKPQAAAMPSAMVPQWSASTPAAPGAAPGARR